MADSWGTAPNDGTGWGDAWGEADTTDHVAHWDESAVANIQEQYDISTYSTAKRNKHQHSPLEGWGIGSQEHPLSGFSAEHGQNSSPGRTGAASGQSTSQYAADDTYNPIRAQPSAQLSTPAGHGIPLSATRLPTPDPEDEGKPCCTSMLHVHDCWANACQRHASSLCYRHSQIMPRQTPAKKCAVNVC